MNTENAPASKDETLWNIAKKRAKFKQSFIIYLLVNTFLWAIWYLSVYNYTLKGFGFPWPMYATLGWGLGIAIQYADAYVFPKSNSTEREYEKLKSKQTI